MYKESKWVKHYGGLRVIQVKKIKLVEKSVVYTQNTFIMWLEDF